MKSFKIGKYIIQIYYPYSINKGGLFGVYCKTLFMIRSDFDHVWAFAVALFGFGFCLSVPRIDKKSFTGKWKFK